MFGDLISPVVQNSGFRVLQQGEVQLPVGGWFNDGSAKSKNRLSLCLGTGLYNLEPSSQQFCRSAVICRETNSETLIFW